MKALTKPITVPLRRGRASLDAQRYFGEEPQWGLRWNLADAHVYPRRRFRWWL